MGTVKAFLALLFVSASVLSYPVDAAQRTDCSVRRVSSCHSSQRLKCSDRSSCRWRHTVRRSKVRNLRTYYGYDSGVSEQMRPTYQEEQAPAPRLLAPLPLPPPPPAPIAPPYGAFQMPTTGNVFNFYAPTTNYFGFAPQPPFVGPSRRSYDERMDPWHGYNGDNGLRNGY